MADIVFTPGDDVTADSTRLPWNNLIYPGNYVSRLNSYRQQGALAIPGVAFFQQIGAYVVPENTSTVATGNYTVNILSPDKRQDDKPRLDRPFVVPGADVGGSGVTVYRVSLNTVNLKGTGSSTITTNATAVGGVTLGNLVDAATGLFPEGGIASPFVMDTVANAITSNTTVGVTVGGAGLTKIDPNKEAAIILEVCFYADAAAPTSDDIALPYPTESGQSSN
tara:strand:+ start:1010 stop:1678 length:669 start_codon:yes stop_codon:yes gene_type:complete